MASYLKEVLGDLLYTKDVTEDMKYLPSPEELQGKILIKAKKVFKNKKVKSKSKSVTATTIADRSSSATTASTSEVTRYTTTVNVHYKETTASSEMQRSLYPPLVSHLV
jgi:hypothetical protein